MHFFFTTLIAATLSATPTQFLDLPVTPKITTIQTQDIKTIKDKIETKVAQLRKANGVVWAGAILHITDTTIEIKNRKGENITLNIDPAITKYFRINGGTKQEATKSDLKNGTYIFATEAQKTSDGIVTYEITIDDPFIVKTGKVIEVNSANYYIKVEGYDKETYTVDIEDTTQRQKLDVHSLQLETIGFSKIQEGDILNFTYTTNDMAIKKTRVTASKILVLPQL